MDLENMYILPYTTEEDYKNNVITILDLLKESVDPESVILTEGEYSYIYKRHDVFDYSIKYDFQHYNQNRVKDMAGSKYKPGALMRYIVCIGTWPLGLVDNYFHFEHPELIVIHIQGPILPTQYARDKSENLIQYNTTLNSLVDILASQFQKN